MHGGKTCLWCDDSATSSSWCVDSFELKIVPIVQDLSFSEKPRTKSWKHAIYSLSSLVPKKTLSSIGVTLYVLFTGYLAQCRFVLVKNSVNCARSFFFRIEKTPDEQLKACNSEFFSVIILVRMSCAVLYGFVRGKNSTIFTTYFFLSIGNKGTKSWKQAIQKYLHLFQIVFE